MLDINLNKNIHFLTGNSKKINYVFIFLEVFEQEGGIQSYVKDLFQAFLSLKEEKIAEVFLLRDEPEKVNTFTNIHSRASVSRLNFRYFKTQPPYLGRLKMATALLGCLLHQQPQHVFCGHVNLAPLVAMFCQPLGIPYTVMTHGKEVWEPLPRLIQFSLQTAAHIWTVSRYTKKTACAANHLNPDRVTILPCAVNGDYFTPGPKPTDLLERYGLGKAKVLLTVARLWSGDIYKGVDVTIRALGAIAQEFPEVKYLVIGRGDDQPRLAQLAQDLGLAERVIFAGFVPNEELVGHYRLADAYVMPSQEGFGIVYLEAMACGIPVVTGDDDGSAEPLLDGKLGWRVPHRDHKAVAEACIEIFRGIDQRCDGGWLREQVLTNFSMDAFQQRLQTQLKATILSSRHQ
ncbi:MAG: glycosyltransferase [Nostocaceae cyanobacterium]|nr:glycosyltransferase [Nostocaceae cyanobacterium]